MKKAKKLLAVIVLAAMLITACSVFLVNAATVKTIAKDKYVQVTKSNKYYYKVTVEKEGYVTLYVKVSGDSYPYAYAKLLNSKKKDFLFSYPNRAEASGKETVGSMVYPVSKGTYYINLTDFNTYGDSKVQIKYTFKAVTQATNYCIAKAKALKSGATDKYYQTPNYGFDRWYKISVSKNKKITIVSTEYAELFDAEGNRVNADYVSTKKYQTSGKVAAGTYYIRVSTISPKQSEICTLKWS